METHVSGGGPGFDAAIPMGHRLREIRKENKLTLRKVSALSSVSISTLSKIENNQVSPSFDIIKRICDGLDVSIEEFVRPGRVEGVTGRKAITRKGEGVPFTSRQYDYTAHATEVSRKGMVPLEIVVHARSIDEFDHWSSHRGEEFVYVLSGEVKIHTELYEPFALATGESAYFDSGMGHLYVSVSREPARVLSVSFDPDQGRRISDFMHPSVQALSEEDERAIGRRRRIGKARQST